MLAKVVQACCRRRRLDLLRIKTAPMVKGSANLLDQLWMRWLSVAMNLRSLYRDFALHYFTFSAFSARSPRQCMRWNRKIRRSIVNGVVKIYSGGVPRCIRLGRYVQNNIVDAYFVPEKGGQQTCVILLFFFLGLVINFQQHHHLLPSLASLLHIARNVFLFSRC